MTLEVKPVIIFGIIALIIAMVLCINSFKQDVKIDEKRIDKQGIIGIWNDKAGLSITTIECIGDVYKLIWVANGGYYAEFPLFRHGDWLKNNDPLGIKYQIIGDRLDVFDNTGFVRSIELTPSS